MRWQILCDFDGTIAIDDTMAGILDAFASPAWHEIDKQMTDGAFGSREARTRQTVLLHAAQPDVERYLETVRIDSGFPTFLAETSKAGLPLTLVSDGYEIAVTQVFARNGIENLDVLANTLLFQDGKCDVAFPFADPDCAVEAGLCKCAAMGRLRNRKSVMIGNGFSDFCTSGAADFVFAKDELAEHCRGENIPHFRFERFEDLIPLIPLISGNGSGLLEAAERQRAEA